MKVSEIITTAQLDISMKVTSYSAREYINEAMEKIAISTAVARIEEPTEIEVTSTTDYYDLPDGTIAVRRIENSNDGTEYNGIAKTRNESIRIFNTGTYSVITERLPSNVSLDTQVPEISVLFHRALAKYVAYKARQRVFKKDDPTAQLLQREFWSMVDYSRTALKNGVKKRPKRIRVPRY